MRLLRVLPLFLTGLLVSGSVHAKELTLLNVSYDPTRELYAELNAAFAKFWLAGTGDQIKVNQCAWRRPCTLAIRSLRSSHAVPAY